MKYQITIKSITDVITNSSSECYQINLTDNDEANEIKKMILDFHQSSVPTDYWNNWEKYKDDDNYDHSSGMGGMLDIYTWKDGFENYKKRFKKDNFFTPQEWAKNLNTQLEKLQTIIFVDTDWAHHATINFIEEYFNVAGSMEGDDTHFSYTLWDMWSYEDGSGHFKEKYNEEDLFN